MKQTGKYIEKQPSKALTGDIPVSEDTALIVVIPCYNEPNVEETLDSLFACDTGDFCTEIILLINSFAISSAEIKAFNRQTYAAACEYARRRNNARLKLLPLLAEALPGHQTGAGQPRKIGMDEALRRFMSIGKEDGVMVSLDADCVVDTNYLTEIRKAFGNKKTLAATIAFHHRTEHLDGDDPLRKAVEAYEMYLHYYRAALEYAGYPYARHTLGSAFAVRCAPYAQVGGMGKQQAGEDFYFLQKIFPLGNTAEITAARVYPAARLSDRVPFGTGPALAKMIAGGEIVKYTYSFESFRVLKSLFDVADRFFRGSIEETLQPLVPCLTGFLATDNFVAEIENISNTTSTLPAFRKRFFIYFNAFKVLKYLNYVHPKHFQWKDVREEMAELDGLAIR